MTTIFKIIGLIIAFVLLAAFCFFVVSLSFVYFVAIFAAAFLYCLLGGKVSVKHNGV